jgi:hypothetical protein
MQFCRVTPKTCLTNDQIEYETWTNRCRNAQFTQSKDRPFQARFSLTIRHEQEITQLSSVVTDTVRIYWDFVSEVFRKITQQCEKIYIRIRKVPQLYSNSWHKPVLVHAMKPYGRGARSGGVAPLILNVDITRAWVISLASRCLHPRYHQTGG